MRTPGVADPPAAPGAVPATAPTPVVGAGLVLAVLAVVGFDLRTAVTSVSAVLPQITAGLHAPAVFDSAASSLAPVVFAGTGLAAPALLHRLGLVGGLLVALVATSAGLVARAAAPSATAFLLLSVVSLAGLGVANVALPAVVKQYLPTQIGVGTAVYTAMLSIGTATAAALTVPLADASGGWRLGLGAWALPALVGVVFAGLLRRSRPTHTAAGGTGSRSGARPGVRTGRPPGGPVTVAAVARTRLGWAVAVLFAGQSACSYVMFAYLPTIAADHGFDPTTAGLLLSVFAILGISASILPLTLGHLQDQRLVVALLSLCWVVGAVGLAFAPAAAWLWVVLLGIGASLFTVGLLLIPMRTRSAAATAALSGFALAVAYVVTAVVVFAAGVLHHATRSWVPVLLAMAVSMTGVAAAGLLAGRPGTIEGSSPA